MNPDGNITSGQLYAYPLSEILHKHLGETCCGKFLSPKVAVDLNKKITKRYSKSSAKRGRGGGVTVHNLSP